MSPGLFGVRAHGRLRLALRGMIKSYLRVVLTHFMFSADANQISLSP
jgi:hypothetical protein